MSQRLTLLVAAFASATVQAPSTYTPHYQKVLALTPVPTPAPTPTTTPTAIPAPVARPTATPAPTPTAVPTLSPPQPPILYFQASAGGGAYGLILAGDPVLISASINTNRPARPFPLESGSVLANLELSVQDERSRVVAPAPRRTVAETPHLESQIGVAFGATPISEWGYDLREPGKYRVSFRFNALTTDWAMAHGYGTRNEFFGNVQIVRSYADVDPHFFPPPKGWRRDRPDRCLPMLVDTRTHFPTLAIGNTRPSGNECFLVYMYKDSIAIGVRRERERGTFDETTLLAEDDDVTCGKERAATFSYQNKVSPFTHTESIVLKRSDGYIVARYERPAAAAHDLAAQDALDAPCALL